MSLLDKAKAFLGNEKQTDSLLDKAEQLAKSKLGHDKAQQINKVRNLIDDRIGDEKSKPTEDNPTPDK
ncbi:Rv0909 family putative TA system antitoxin [Corynebacterium sp. A21]|uniref:Rv0909 family putative TA system antitoxin n=1 Tax=Corynebacterium sp. A21 TaxID=3457318 RepID=UPI003FD455B8